MTLAGGIRPLIRRNPAMTIALLLTLLAVLRIVSTYRVFSQAYDEPAHLACGMEWLDKGTFMLEPIHPPLPRVAAAMGPYLAGLRLPNVKIDRDERGDSFSIYPAGNEILLAENRYQRNLTLMRLGMLPFFLVAAAVVFFWSRSLLGEWPAVMALLLFSTLPPILAFAGLAYVDFSLAAFLPAALFGFTLWLEDATVKRSIVLGLMAGCAVLANFTAFLFLPPCLLVTALAKWGVGRAENVKLAWRGLGKGALVALLAMAILIWGAYRFSLQRLDKVFDRPAHDIARLRLPLPAKWVALKIASFNPVVPAPELIKGLAGNFNIGKAGYEAYLFGKVRQGGWWYFYLAVLVLKTPLAFVGLSIAGIVGVLGGAKAQRDWRLLAVAASVIVILALSMPIKVDLGIRHILFIYPLLSVLAAYALAEVWKRRLRWPRVVLVIAFVLVLWQVVTTAWIHPDYTAYVNELGGRHPEEKIVYGCDFDCGQDVFRLGAALRSRGIDHLHVRVWTSGDLSKMNLPPYKTLLPGQRVTGWVAASVLYLEMGNTVWTGQEKDAYRWLEDYKPVAYAGKTIRLYYIPPDGSAGASKSEGTGP
jgi:hypothetical protein